MLLCLVSVLEQGSRSSSRSSSPSVRMPAPEKTCSRAYFSPEDPTGTGTCRQLAASFPRHRAPALTYTVSPAGCCCQSTFSRLSFLDFIWSYGGTVDGLPLKQPDTLRRSGKLCWSSCSNSLFLLRHQRLRQLHSHGVSHPGSPAAGRPARMRVLVCVYRWTV